MIHHRTRFAVGLTMLAFLGAVGGCGEPGSAGGNTPVASGSGERCVAIPGDQLVVLTDDLHLQTVDNIIPAINGAAAAQDQNLVPLLDSVSAALTTDKLIALNKSVDVERNTSAQAAAQFVQKEGLTQPALTGSGSITVGAANFSESATLAAIYAEVLEAAGYTVTVQSLDAREVYLPALEKGQVTVFPEYLGTVTEYLNTAVNGAGAPPLANGDVTETLTHATELGQARGLVFGKPSDAQDQNSFAVTKEFAQTHDLSTLSDLADACGSVTLGAGPECPERPFCQPGLEQTYGLSFDEVVALDSGGPLTKTALQQGQVILGLVFSSDGQLG